MLGHMQKPIIAILSAQTEDKGIPIEKVSMGYTHCVHQLGEGLHATAHSCDGHIEMIENQDHSVVGVQWHPECLKGHELTEEIFKHFVQRSLS